MSPWRGPEGSPDAAAEPRFKGRFTAPDRRDYFCRAIDMSAEVVALRSDYAPGVGERIALHLDPWGKFQGAVIRVFAGGFTVDLEVADRNRAHVAMQLAWLSRRAAGEAAFRLHERLTPRRRFTTFTVQGVTLPCEVLDLSRSGASVRTHVKVPDGAAVTLGRKTIAEVARQTDQGFAVRFRRLLPLERFDEDIEL
ncbi:pilus assembly protein PilZ [Methylosinus sp. Sm6]|nr:pilus assembly protein PilZ [Methylosinus sp. Sm6]MBY6240674.1 pilus assembly protein PilZ [Methylosinus sp. Sm6]